AGVVFEIAHLEPAALASDHFQRIAAIDLPDHRMMSAGAGTHVERRTLDADHALRSTGVDVRSPQRDAGAYRQQAVAQRCPNRDQRVAGILRCARGALLMRMVAVGVDSPLKCHLCLSCDEWVDGMDCECRRALPSGVRTGAD